MENKSNSKLSYQNENVERVYVDWPEAENEEFRFISSRMEDLDSDMGPLTLQKTTELYHNPNLDINQLKYVDSTKFNNRFEDLSKKKSKKIKHSSVPPLDLISQNSSIEIPGAKGIIDIDLRSSSESLSDCSQEYSHQSLKNFQKDSLEMENVNGSNYKDDSRNFYNPLLNTTLPDVKHSDLVLNHDEYDSSRHNQGSINNRKFSEISIPSQYRTESSYYERKGDQRTENEKAVFEAAKLKYKQSGVNVTHKSGESDGLVSQQSKFVKSKPTMLVAPQIKQPLHGSSFPDKSINFVELNKNPSNLQKSTSQSSYSSKFLDRYKKECFRTPSKSSASFKDLEKHQKSEERSPVNHNPDYSIDEVVNKRKVLSDKMMNNNSKMEHHELPNLVSDYPTAINSSEFFKPINPSHILYAYNQYGEPIIINAESILVANNPSKYISSRYNSPQYSNYSDQYNYSKEILGVSSAPSSNHIFPLNEQETQKFSKSDFLFKESLSKRHFFPLLLLERKLN